MRKALIPFLVAGMLSATSCTELFEPSVDYGNQTYINDYSALVSAVNDLNKTLSERFDALNSLLEKEMANIALSIDENTGAIKVMDSNLKEGLGTINTTLFNGFSALNTTIDKNGDRIVYAMNQNGELLRLQLDSTGKLISAEIKASTTELVKVINSQTATVAEKLAALTTITEAGLADVSVKIDNVNNTLEVQLKDVNANLGKIDTDMFNGFTALTAQVKLQGENTIIAINEQKEALIASIDKNGLLISAELVSLNKNQANIDKNLGELLDAFSHFVTENKTNLESINTTIAALNPTLEALGIKITANIDNQTGQLITAITKLGNDLAGSIAEQTVALNKAIAANTAAIVSADASIQKAINDRITELKNSTDANSAAQIAILNKMLADDGVYKDGNNLYMTPEIWASVEAAGVNSSVYQSFATPMTTTYPSITTVQVTPSLPWHTCAQFTKTSEDGSILVGGNMQPMTLANGKTVVRVIKTPGTIYYSVVAIGCSYPFFKKVTVSDAKAPQPANINTARTEWTGSALTVTNVKLYTYYDGVIVTNISSWAYSEAN